MLLSDFFEKKRKQRIEAAKAEGFAQGKAEAEAKVLNEFAERIEAAQGKAEAEAKVLNEFAERFAQGNIKAAAKVLSKFTEQIEKAKTQGREEGIAEGRIEGATEVYNRIFKWINDRKEAEARGKEIPVEKPNELFQITPQWDKQIFQHREELENYLFETDDKLK